MSALAILLPMVQPVRRRGMGALSPTSDAIANQAASAASMTGVLIGAMAGIPVAGPIAAAIAGVGLLLAQVFSGCGDTCVEATNLANQAEPLLLQNLQTYLSSPVRYKSMQAAAINNFVLTWNALQQACSDPSLGAAGKACISDRAQGSCAYKTSPGGWQQGANGWEYVYPGANGSGDSCWNWFVGYYDPIANDPDVQPDPVPGAGALSSVLSSVGLSPSSTIAGLPAADVALGGLGLLALWWALS